MKEWEKHLEKLNKNYNKVNCDNRIKLPKEEIKRLRKDHWTLKRIGLKYNVTKQRISQLTRDRKRYSEPKKSDYYCNKCEKEFNSKLPLEDAICVHCGSENIIES